MPKFERLNKKLYSWNNDKKGVKRKASCIDKFYIPPTIKDIGGQTRTIASYKKVFDHSLVVLKLVHQSS